MKVKVVLAVALLALISAVKAETLSFTSTFKAEDVTLVPAGNGETLIDWKDGSLGASAPGKPWIPTKTITFRLPAGFAYISHEVEVGDAVLLASDVVPIPEQPPVPTGEEQTSATPRDAAAYASAEPYPALRGRFASKGSMRGVPLVSFELAPIWYVAAEKKLYLASSITVKVKAEPQPMPTGPSASSFPASPLFENSVNSLVVNPETESAPLQIAASAAKGGSGAEYLVITGPGLTDGAQMLADFRGEFNGVGTKVVTTDEIATSYSGSDLQEKIRACITWYVANKGTTTVVLAGDDTIIPTRLVKMIMTNGYSDTGPTDLYYSDLTGTYEPSESGFIYQTDSLRGYSGLDLNPDVVVGRIPVRTGTQLCDYVRKVISYERTTTADSDIVRKTLIGGYTIGSNLTRVGDTGNDWRDSKQGSISFAVAAETFRDGMKEYLDFKDGEMMSDAEVRARRLNKIYRLAYNPYFRTSFFFGTTSSWDQNARGDHVQGYDTFTAALSRGYHQAMVDAHGNYTLWGQGVTGNGPFFNADYAMLLSNRVDFVYTVACYTGGFDMAEPSLSEGFLRARYGALGYIGCSRYGWDYNMCAYGTTSGTSDWCLTGILRGQSLQYAVEFQKRIYGLDKDGNTFDRDTTLGAAFMNHKAAFASKWSDLYTLWLTFYINLQGDPLLTYHLPPRETGTDADSAESGLVTLLRDRPVAVSANSATVRLAADEIVLGKTAAVSLEYSTLPQFSSVTTVPVGDFTQQTETEKTITGLSPATTYYVRAKSVIGQTHMSPFSLSFTTLPANTVGGTVLDAGGNPAANVTVRAKDGSGTVVGTTQTGADGVYALTLSAGWTGTVEVVAPQGFAASAAASVTIPSGGSATADFTLTKVVYVDGRASGKNDGTSWADAFTTLPAALKVAAAGDQVWVAEGVYTPEEIAAYGRDCHFAPASGVFVYGGFAGNETSLSARDWIAHPTVLSGDIGTKGNASDNCLHLIRYAAGALFDGFGLTGANMDTFVNKSTSDSSFGAVVGSPESNPSAKVVGGVYPQIGENPGSTSGSIFFDHCAVTNNSATAGSYDGANLVGNVVKAVFRNCLIARNTVKNASRNGMMNYSLLDNCTVTENSSEVAPFSMARIRNTIVVGNIQSSSCGVKTSAESGSDGTAGRQRVIFMGVAKASSGSDRFMSESYYRDSTATGLDIPSDAWYPAAPGWTTKDGFAYALNEDSGAAEKGKVLEWMTEDTLDYLGNPRVHGTAPDLGCCEAVADAGGEEEDDDDDDDDEIVRPEDAPVKPENEINAMTWETLFPTAKTYADSATSFNLPYRQHSPTTADGVKYPLVIFLHGAGESGDDNAKQVQTPNDVIPITKYAMKHGDAFVLAPQCPGASGSDYSLTWSGADWNVCPMTRLDTPTKPMAAVIKLIEEFVAENPVDPTRIYVTGLSMGGFGTWDLASRMTTTFAAVMPCCGGVDASAAELYRGQSIRFFHGAEDKVVVPQFSRAMTNALAQAGIAYDYIEYPGTGHEACWRKAYVDTEDNLEWLFGHIKGEEYVAPDHGDTTPNAPLSTVANGGWLGWKLDKDATTIVNCGTKVWAYAQNYSCLQNHFGANLVVNEVVFTKSGGFAADDTGIKNHITCDRTFYKGNTELGTEDLNDGTSDFARMLKTGWEAVWDQGPVQTYTLHGLTVGKLYLVQFIYHCASKDRAGLSVIAPDGTTSTRVSGWDANGQNLDENWRYGGSLVGVFTASGSDQTLVITYSKTANYILNAVQLREVTVADLTDGPAIEYGTPTIGSVTPSVNGTTATLTLANVASGENGGCYQVWLAYAEDGTTLGSETAALISQQSASCAVEIKNLTAGKKYNYSLYVKNEGNVISAKKTGSFTIPGGEEPVDPEDISNPTKALVNHFTFNLSSRRFYDCIQERDAVLIDNDLATIENLSVADVPSTVTDYNKAIALPQYTGLKVAHSIPTNAAHPYCLVIRFYSPSASHGTWRALYQTIQENNTDASLFLQNSNDGGIGKGGETSWRGYYGSVSDDVWHSLVVSVDTVNSVSALYLDGTKIREISSASGPNDLTGRPYIYFGLDNDGEDNTLYFDDIRIYNEAKPLAVFDGDSVRAGGPDDTIGGGDPEPPADQEWTAIPMTESGDAFSTDGDLVFAFCRDQADPGSTRCNEATSIPINLVNLLTDTVTSITGGASINGVYDDGRNPGDFVAASPELSSATDQLGNEDKGVAWDTWGTILSHAWTGPSLSETDGKATFTFKGLTEGHEYLVEFFVHDHGQTKTVTAPDGETAVTYGGTGWQYGGILRGTFTAEGTTHDVVLTYSDSGSYMLNALQLRDLGVAQGPTINERAAELASGGWLVCPLTGKPGDIVTCGELVMKSSKGLTYAPRQIAGDDSVAGVSFLENAITFFDDGMSLDLWSNYKVDEDSLGDCGLAGAYGKLIANGWGGQAGSGCANPADAVRKLKLNGLESGKTYLIQGFVHDGTHPARQLSVGGGTITYGAATSADEWYYGGTFVHVFTASAATYEFDLDYTAGQALVNALQLREVEAAQEDDPVVPPPIYQLTIPAKAGLVLDSVTTNGTSVAGAEGVYSVVSNTEVTITFTAASGYELDGNEGVVTKTIVSNYTFADADYPAVKEQGGEDPVDPPVGPGGSYAVTGAEEIIDGDYVVYVWNDPTQSGTLTISGSVTADYLVVGGGGAGGYCRGGGGGGGGVVYKTAQTLGAGVYTITVGVGGTPDTFSTDGACYQKSKTSESANGGSSSISVSAETVCEAFGGGGGGNFVNGSTANSEGLGYISGSRNVATGGGSTGKSTTAPSGREGQGFAGGAAFSGGDNSSGGGGGAGAVGLPATASRVSGNGGAGVVCAITGEEAYYGGGGGAGVYCNTNDGESNRGTSGEGGLGGGGHGGTFHNDDLTAGTDGLGGGGGGASGCGNKFDYCGGAKGGSGVVIIRLPRATGKEDDPAETGVWIATPVSSDAREFSTDGDLVWAMTCSSGDPGRTHYLNGIPFGDCGYTSGTDYLLSDYAVFSPAMNGAQDKFGYEGLSTDAMTFGGTLARGWFYLNANGTGNFTMTLKGLTAGRKYRVQVFTHNSGENKNDHNDGLTTDTITAPDGEQTITYGGEGWKYGGILTGTFVATNAQHSFAFTHSRSNYFQVNAIQLREIEAVTPPPAHEHVWSDWVTNTPPTATTPGERTRTCIAAGCTVPPVTETEVVPATGGGDEPVDPPQDGPGSIVEAAAVLAPGYWYAAPLTGDPEDIVTNGTMATTTVAGKGNKNLSGAKSYGTVNGVDFGGSWSGDSGMTSSPNSVSRGKDFGSSATCGIEGQYGQVLKNAFDSGNNDGPCTFTFSGLDPAKTYLVQYIIHSTDAGHTADVSGVNGMKSIRLGATSADDDWYYGGTLIHVFKPAQDGTYSLVIDYRKNGDAANAIVNAFQVREVEEREAPAATNGWISKPMTLAGNGNGAAFSEEGTQVFAFMPDDGDQGTTATNLYACNIQVNLLNSLTDTVNYLHDATQKEWGWQQDSQHPWNGVFNDGRQPVDFMTVVPELTRNTGCETVSGASDNFNCMLKRAFINYNDETAMTVTFKNLTAGSVYVAELYVHHGINGDKKSVTAPDGVTKAYYGGDGDWRYGGILSGRFVATGTEQSFTFTYSASNALQLNAIQLRDLGGVTPPEPPEPKRGFLLIVR